MVAKRHDNNIRGSRIRAIITYTGDNCGTLGPRFDVQAQDYSMKEKAQDQLAEFLNEATGRNGSEREISEELEKAIVNDFYSVLSEEKDIYIYKGCKSLNPEEAWQLTLKKVREEEYNNAPKRITRFNNKLVVDENLQVLPIGITPMRISLNAEKLGKKSIEQSKLNEAVCAAARKFTLLPHIKYKDSMYGRDNANGTMPALFFENKGQYSFRSRNGIRPSDVIRSVFTAQKNPLILECAVAMQIIQYKAILDFLGEEKFNKFFAEGIVMESNISGNNPIIKVRDQLSSDWYTIVKSPERMLEKITPGDTVYVANIKPYAKRHPSGESPGFNVIYLGKNENGQHEFGSLFTEKKVHTYDEIIDLMIHDYNKVPHDMKDKVTQIDSKCVDGVQPYTTVEDTSVKELGQLRLNY